jgi:urease accessory protein
LCTACGSVGVGHGRSDRGQLKNAHTMHACSCRITVWSSYIPIDKKYYEDKKSNNITAASLEGVQAPRHIHPSKDGGTVQRIDHIVKPEAQEAQHVVDTVALTWEARQKSRQRLRTAQGQELALALPTGTRLQAGALLPTASGYIVVALAPEDVLCIAPQSLQEAAFVAYQIGNRHLPLEIAEEELKTLYEPVLAAYLGQHAIVAERRQVPFMPVTAAGHV